jgi:hypothetical protein
MLAIFDPLKRPQNGRTDLDVPVGTRDEISSERAAVARHEAAVKSLTEQVQALDDQVLERFFRSGRTNLAPEVIAAHKLPEKERSDVQKKVVNETLKQFNEELAQVRTADENRQRETFVAAMKTIEAAPPHSLPRAYIWQESEGPIAATHVFRRGNPATPAGTVDPGFPGVLASCAAPFLAPAPDARTSLRRLSLARWMTGPKNPLVPRVIVNRLWQGHFGEGLVTTESDFGVMGASPSHPQLLDWLANELRSPSAGAEVSSTSPWSAGEPPTSPPLSKGGQGVSGGEPSGIQKQNAGTNTDQSHLESGGRDTGSATPPTPPLLRGGDASWRLKHIHRLIVLSATYGQASDFREAAAKIEVDNARLWRFPYRRLDAEAVRDAVLAVNGRLDATMGGPGVYPKIARAVLEGQSRPGDGWGKFDEREASRRSIYVFVKRSLLVPEMELLDFADTNTSCEQRPVSTIPTQALTLLNGEFLNEEARHFAARLVRDVGSDRESQIERAYRLALCRSPTAEEKIAALAFLDRQAAQITEEDRAKPEKRPRSAPAIALEALCLVLYNLNEFVYVD